MNCPTCGQETGDLATTLNIACNWDRIEDLEVGHTFWVFEIDDFVEMVVKPAPHETDSYGEGVAEDIFMVVRVGDKLFRKDGFRSSYGYTEWGGDIREVKPQPRTVTVYDYV